ncbi:transketolase [Arthrobacter sp. TB 23]|uniref:transketolase n=1 Tax=Arthrobacter sp. TB 23 TaxID=494419 RepID=UPI00030D9FE2|nr:transketolase [Arthrobacter sp. TB 23]
MNTTPGSDITDVDLVRLAQEGRWLVLSTVARTKAGHIGGPLSAMDMLVTLYFDTLRRDPSRPDDPDRDRFILSKGHNAIALYAVMALRGYLPVEELGTFDQGNSRLQGHPDLLRLPGLDASTGSLGQGLAVGAGMALEARRQGKEFTTFVMLGDGEHQEGMVWESVACASRYKLDNLVAIIDRNGLQQYGWDLDGGGDSRFDRLDPWAGMNLSAIYRGFGWNVVEVDGHDIPELRRSFSAANKRSGKNGRPTVFMARTSKGRGVSFTEGEYKWHNGVATDAQLAQARLDLGLEVEV